MTHQSQETPPPSPCINVCVLNDKGTCTGCLRTVEEIAAWGSMSPRDQWALLAKLPKRRENG